MTTCKQCGCDIEAPKREFCSRHCSGKWRRNNIYGDKYTLKYRAASPRNFMMCLCKKKKERRDLSIDTLMEIYERQEGKCALTGIEMTYTTGEGRVPTNISIDQIIPSAGYTPDNIRLVCTQANKMKMELTDADLLTWAKALVQTLEGKI
jgi:hypothetical protein